MQIVLITFGLWIWHSGDVHPLIGLAQSKKIPADQTAGNKYGNEDEAASVSPFGVTKLRLSIQIKPSADTR
jgi:hypothetical protein